MAITLPVVLMFACNGGPNDPNGDTTPPQIVSVSPAEDAVEVAVDAVIRVVFSEAIDTNKITAATFTIGPAVTGGFHFSGDTVVFAPASELDYLTTYNVSVTTGVTDLAGNRMATNKSWSFETAGNPATTPPLVIATIPANGAGDVDAADTISATFSKAIDTATLTASSFTVSGDVTGTISYADSTATFTPDDTLEFNTLYTATLGTTVADTFGNHLATPYVWSFTTGDDPMIPTAFIWKPSDRVIIGDTVTIQVLAGHLVAVTKVEFYRNGQHIAEADDNTYPYEYLWDASAETLGSEHSIHARAHEAEGRVGFSDTITLFYQWEELVTDANDLWATDIKRILARSTDTTIEFRYEFWEPWFDPYDTIPDDTTLDLGIYFDTDRDGGTGRTDFDGTNLNGIGAEYRVIIGMHGWDTTLAIWTGSWQKVYDYTGFKYLNLPPFESTLEFGMKWNDIGNPQSMRMVSINLFYFSTESFVPDWAPDQGSGYVTVPRENRYIGEGYTESSSKSARSHQAASTRRNPF
jgi:hypothetical protein